MSADNSIGITCPKCQRKLRVKVAAAGKRAKCPNAVCGAFIIIPSTADPDPEGVAPRSRRRLWPWYVGGTAVIALAVGIAIAVGVANRLEAKRLKAALIGTWVATDGQLLVMEFHEDGTATMTPFGTKALKSGSPDELTEAEFQPVGSGLVELQLTNPPTGDKYTFRPSVNRDELILRDQRRLRADRPLV